MQLPCHLDPDGGKCMENSSGEKRERKRNLNYTFTKWE